ncbi:phage tail tape measure protein [Paenibacillus sp. 481]|uniref:phage tail tape measure protein n=1 Tax=Paenibacillus sp. 481 TaxID=2835869 RepID=UPI001E4A3148|nr:phage tail tape measure protein [Paenibacillus sp. 481]UHA71936.1 phage tail tape measure protein [Paenibacillus sp. 481]
MSNQFDKSIKDYSPTDMVKAILQANRELTEKERKKDKDPKSDNKSEQKSMGQKVKDTVSKTNDWSTGQKDFLGILAKGGSLVYDSHVNSAPMMRTGFLIHANLKNSDEKSADAKFEQLQLAAFQQSAKIPYSSSNISEAQLALISSGRNDEEVKAMMPTIGNFATANTVDLVKTANMQDKLLAAYGKKVTDIASVSESLSYAKSKGKLEIFELGEAMQQVAPLATEMGWTFDDMAAAFAQFGNEGVRGSDAANSLLAMMRKLQDPGGKARGQLTKLGVKFPEKAGVEIGFADLMQQIGQLNESGQKNAIQALSLGASYNAELANLFNQGALINISEYKSKIPKIEGNADEMKGNTAVMAASVNQGSAGALNAQSAATDHLAMNVANQTQAPFIAMSSAATEAMNAVNTMPSMLQGLFLGVGGTVTAIAGLTATLLTYMGGAAVLSKGFKSLNPFSKKGDKENAAEIGEGKDKPDNSNTNKAPAVATNETTKKAGEQAVDKVGEPTAVKDNKNQPVKTDDATSKPAINAGTESSKALAQGVEESKKGKGFFGGIKSFFSKSAPFLQKGLKFVGTAATTALKFTPAGIIGGIGLSLGSQLLDTFMGPASNAPAGTSTGLACSCCTAAGTGVNGVPGAAGTPGTGPNGGHIPPTASHSTALTHPHVDRTGYGVGTQAATHSGAVRSGVANGVGTAPGTILPGQRMDVQANSNVVMNLNVNGYIDHRMIEEIKRICREQYEASFRTFERSIQDKLPQQGGSLPVYE